MSYSSDVAAWIDDIAQHAEAIEAIADLGVEAIDPLCRYLRRGPQIIPQPRCFAIAMLARLSAEEATEGLRDVVRSHRLRDLPALFSESEYVVKNDAFKTLEARAPYVRFADDVAFGVSERLPAAIHSAAAFGLASLAPALVDFLDDDVLAESAGDALLVIGTSVSTALLARLDAWLWQSPYAARPRLAAVRALGVLVRLKVRVESEPIVKRALRDPHPIVRGAAAALLSPRERGGSHVDALVRGVLAHDRSVVDACRDALDAVGRAVLEPALRALRRDAEPDLYGHMHPPTTERRRWLAIHLLESTLGSALQSQQAQTCNGNVFADAIEHGPALSTETLSRLLRHGRTPIRRAAVIALSRSSASETGILLAECLLDSNAGVRRCAFFALSALPTRQLASIGRPPLWPLTRSLLLRARLRLRLRRLRSLR